MPEKSFRELLSNNKNSKKVIAQIFEAISKDPAKMDELMDCFFDESLRLSHYASWPVGKVVDVNPEWIFPYLEKMLHNLDAPHHDAVVRNTFRCLQFLEIPEEIEGLAFEKAFEFLLNPQNAVAIRVFAMTVCGNIALKYPELKQEVIPVIEENMPYGSAGFKSRGAKILRKLRG